MKFLLSIDNAYYDSRNYLNIRYSLGSKVFFLHPGSDTLINDFSLLYDIYLHKYFSPGVSFDIKDKSDYDPAVGREYTSLSTGFDIRSNFSKYFSLFLNAGYKNFVYQTDETFNNEGPFFYGQAESKVHEDVRLTLSYDYRRSYYYRSFKMMEMVSETGEKYVSLCDGVQIPNCIGRRDDQVHRIDFSITYLKKFYLKFDYGFEYSLSNSYTMSFMRHVFDLNFSIKLFWEIFLYLKLTFQLFQYTDDIPAMVDPTLSLNDENRNAVIVGLSRDIYKGLSIQIRYSAYFSNTELDSPTELSYFRQVVSLALSYNFKKGFKF